MRSFWGDYIFGGFWTTRREIGAERTTNTHVLGKGRPGEKVGVERTTRTEYVLFFIIMCTSDAAPALAIAESYCPENSGFRGRPGEM